MNTIKMFYHPWGWHEKQPSKSFIKKLSLALTEQIADLVESVEHKKCLAEILELRIDDFNKMKIDSSSFILPMCIMAQSQPLEISHCYVVWSQNMYPWDDWSDVTVDLTLKISRNEVKKLNSLIPLLYTPVVSSNESGLPYDYQIKNKTADGKLVIYPVSEFTTENVQQISNTLYNFFDRYNSENTYKIHYIGDFKMAKSGSISIALDFASCPEDAIISCVHSFDESTFIKKILFK